jgi:hypothetical protein
VGWAIALGEYLIMIPANRLGYAGGLSVSPIEDPSGMRDARGLRAFHDGLPGESGNGTIFGRFACLRAVFFIFRPDRG